VVLKPDAFTLPSTSNLSDVGTAPIPIFESFSNI
jgi:hypothetical protein